MNLNLLFFKEEMRSGFLVTEKRKKIWAVELQILEKFDEVCKKHHLTYYAYYGTLLGAVRHQGFIPWDDDIDVVMFRDDYEKLKDIALEEFSEPYFFQNSYNDNMLWAFSKVRDSRTTAIEFPNMRDFHQGIFIDIFPLDDVPDNVNLEYQTILEVQKEIWATIMNPKEILSNLDKGVQYVLAIDVLVDLIKMDRRKRLKEFETFNRTYFGKSRKVNFITDEIFSSTYKSVDKDWFKNTIFLPFENILIPAPAEYDKVLTRSYGDYHQFIPGGTAHESIILEPDIPYKEYFSKYLQVRDRNS